MAQRYAYLYTSGRSDGYLFVSFLGMGAQGCACLVKSITTGKLYVRKTAFINHRANLGEYYNAAMYPHANIPRVVDAVLPPRPTPGIFTEPNTVPTQFMLTTYWEYMNGGNLLEVFRKYRALNEPVPEILLWKLTDQMLAVTSHLRSHRAVQCDLLPCNIFLDWSKNTLLPDFSLGDYGRSKSYAQRTLGNPPNIQGQTGTIALRVIAQRARHETHLYAMEIHSIAAVLHQAIFDPRTHEPRPVYTRALVSLYNALVKCPTFPTDESHTPTSLATLNNYIAHLTRYTALVLHLSLNSISPSTFNPTQRRTNILIFNFPNSSASTPATPLSQLLTNLDLIRPLTDANALPIITYDDLPTLQGYPYAPPGPWLVGIVNEQGSLIDWVRSDPAYANSPFITGVENQMLLRADLAEVEGSSGFAQFAL